MKTYNPKSFVFKKTIEINIKPLTLSDHHDIQFHSNPAKSYLNVTLKNSATIEIHNIQGQLLINKQLSLRINNIPVINLPPGSYIL